MRTRPDIISQLDLPNGPVTVDEAGYLTDPDQWSEAFAEWVANQEGLTLSDLHWRVIGFMRDYHEEHGIAADARFVLAFLARECGVDKAGAKQLLFELFPYGYVKQACKMAGMRQPRAWSTG
ncbi:MAG: TusE/DsrC/DsvC family sulfur relay protein [Alphaproteobacteria bacterium]|nr:MAG: TusE/DsrC/DsvC family sulfur relay protein [Alphaproteobacteria bacterium]